MGGALPLGPSVPRNDKGKSQDVCWTRERIFPSDPCDADPSRGSLDVDWGWRSGVCFVVVQLSSHTRFQTDYRVALHTCATQIGDATQI